MIIYIEESGTLPGSDTIAVVGYAASPNGWECVEKAWMETLELYGASELHRLWENQFPCPDWPERKRMDLLEALTEIVRSHTSFGVGAILNVQDYEQFAPAWFRRENEHPYYFAFQLFFDMLLGTLEKLLDPPLPPQQKLTFVLDQNEYMQKSAGTFLQLKALRDTRDRMGTITFKSRKDCPLLGVAGLIACLMQEAARPTQGKPEREWARELRQRYNLISGIYDRENIPGLVQRMMAAKLKAASTNFGQATRVG